jgi:hypothetical protein
LDEQKNYQHLDLEEELPNSKLQRFGILAPDRSSLLSHFVILQKPQRARCEHWPSRHHPIRFGNNLQAFGFIHPAGTKRDVGFRPVLAGYWVLTRLSITCHQVLDFLDNQLNLTTYLDDLIINPGGLSIFK